MIPKKKMVLRRHGIENTTGDQCWIAATLQALCSLRSLARVLPDVKG